MKKFKFTLQTVHNVRELRQETEQMVLSQLQAEAERAAEQIERIDAAYVRAINEYSEKLNGGRRMHVGEMELDTLHLSSLERQKRLAVELFEDKKRACAAQSLKLAAAAREVKVTNRLRESQASRHRLDAARDEQNAIDDLVSANFAREMRTKQ